MKRTTHYPQYFLGLTINQGLFIGYAAIAGHSPFSLSILPILPMYLALVAWTVVYDTIYAHQDKHFDTQLSLGSTALLWGQQSLPVL
jgi:4-hydroxybenzoate polyprenyltransferase